MFAAKKSRTLNENIYIREIPQARERIIAFFMPLSRIGVVTKRDRQLIEGGYELEKNLRKIAIKFFIK